MAQAGRGGGGAKGGQGGAGSPGSGAGSTGGRDAAMGGGSKKAGGGTKERSFLEGVGDLLGGPAAYANNPNAPGGKWAARDFMTASYPDANWQAIADSLISAPMGALGFASKIASAAMDPMGPGMGMFGKAFGANYGAPGPNQPGGGVGRANQGGGGALGGYQLSPGYMSPQPTAPTVNPTPMVPPVTNQMNQPGKYLGIAPGYGAGVPGYNYFGPMKR